MASPHDAAAYLKTKLGTRRPRVGIVLGSGLGPLAGQIEDAVAIPYADIPGFHVSSVAGHAGRLVAGTLPACRSRVCRGACISMKASSRPRSSTRSAR